MRRARTALRSVALALALSGAGCAHMAGDSTVCPEYRNLRCMTAPECSMDQQRGCRVCSCSPARDAGTEGKLPNPVQPDQRIPERR